MAEGPPGRAQFPMGDVGRGQWLKAKADYATAQGTHKEQRSVRGQTAADEKVNVGSGAKSEALKQRQGERKEDYTARVERSRRKRATPASKPSPRGESQRKVLADERKGATPKPKPKPGPTPEMSPKMKAYHGKWLSWDKKQRPNATDADRSARFDAKRKANAAKKKE